MHWTKRWNNDRIHSGVFFSRPLVDCIFASHVEQTGITSADKNIRLRSQSVYIERYANESAEAARPGK